MTRIFKGGARPLGAHSGFTPSPTRPEAGFHLQPRRPWGRAKFLPAAVALLLVAACSSDPKPGPSGAGGPRAKPPTTMAGQEKFFDGRILAEVGVGTDGVPDAAASEGRRGGGSEGGGGRRRGGSHGQLGIAGGAGGFGGNISGGVPLGEGGERRRGGGGENGGMGGPRPGGMMGGGRPVMIHLRFTNLGDTAVTLAVDDFVSPLGNFAVRPEKLELAPGQSLETEPMTSQLAGFFTEVDATLVLRIGSQGDKRTFHLHAVKPPAAEGEKAGEPQAPNPPKS